MTNYQFDSVFGADHVSFHRTANASVALAAEASDTASPLGTFLSDSFPKIVNVEKFGVRRFPLVTEASQTLDPSPTSADYTANDAAFAASTAEALAVHGTISIPTGLYPLNNWTIDARGTQCLTIEGNGSVLLCSPAFEGGATQGSAFIWVGSSAAGPDGANFLRQATIRSLNIQGHAYQIGGDGAEKKDRIGLVLHGIQELLAERVWVSQFGREGWWFDTVYDSTFKACGAAWCGRSSPTESSGLNFYATRIESTVPSSPVDNSNGLRFVGFHWEYCSLILDVGDWNRHLYFLGCKSEHGRGGVGTNASELSPIVFRKCKEVAFLGCTFVQNQWDLIGAQTHPYHVSSEYVSGDGADRTKKQLRFVGCDFTTPDDAAESWFIGHQATFEGCTFGRTGAQPGRPAFNLGNDVAITNATIHMAATLVSSTGASSDVFRFFGSGSLVSDPTIYFAASPPAGAMVTIGAHAADNLFRGFKSAHGESPTRWVHEGGETQLASNRVEGWNHGEDRVLTPSAPDVMGLMHAILDPGTYTDFVGSYIGQRMLLRARGDGVILQNNAGLITGTGADRTLNGGQPVTIQRIPAAWVITSGS